MDWEVLKSVKCWTPLANLGIDFKKLGDNLYKIDKNQYVVAQPYNQNFERDLHDKPYVTVMYWGDSDNAVNRVVNRTLVDFSSEMNDIPETLKCVADVSYGKIKEHGMNCIERGVYGGISGDFISKVVDIDEFSYYYFDRGPNPLETPSVIEVVLK